MLFLLYFVPGLLGQASNDLLFIDSDHILELPSFNKSTCKVDRDKGFLGDQSGIVDNYLTVCDFFNCRYLCAGGWREFPSMKTPRYFGGSSDSSSGWFVTGGWDTNATILATTEVYTTGNGWTAGPKLPIPLFDHCQLLIGETVYILGNPFLKLW